MKLNWVLYYNGAVLIALPAVLYYLNQYLKPYWTALIMLVFAGWYGIKVPQTIKEIDGQRDDCHQFMTVLAEQVEQGKTVYLYNPGEKVDNFDYIQRVWIYNAVETFLAYYMNNEGMQLERVSSFEGRAGIYVTIDKNEVLYPGSNVCVEETGEKIAHNEFRMLDAWEVK